MRQSVMGPLDAGGQRPRKEKATEETIRRSSAGTAAGAAPGTAANGGTTANRFVDPNTERRRLAAVHTGGASPGTAANGGTTANRFVDPNAERRRLAAVDTGGAAPGTAANSGPAANRFVDPNAEQRRLATVHTGGAPQNPSGGNAQGGTNGSSGSNTAAFDPTAVTGDAALYYQTSGRDPNADAAHVRKWWNSFWRGSVDPSPRDDGRTQNERDAQDILGVGATYAYTGDPEDTARQTWAYYGVDDAAGYRDVLDYYTRNLVGGILDMVRDSVNDISRRAQASMAEQEAENAYWQDVFYGGAEARAAEERRRAGLTQNERDMEDILGVSGHADANYYLQLNQEAQERHKDDVYVQAVDWGEEYNRETQRMAEEKGFSDRVIQEGNSQRSFGRMLPALAVSTVSGLGAGAVGKEAAELLMGVARLFNGSVVFHSAAGSAYEEAIRQGADQESALNYATAVGACELFSDHIINGMGRIGGRAIGLGGPGDRLAESFARNIAGDAAGRRLILSVCDMLGEGAEEYFSEIGSYFADRLFLKKDERTFLQAAWDARKVILEAAMTSALCELSSFLLSGVPPEQAIPSAVDAAIEEAKSIVDAAPASAEQTADTVHGTDYDRRAEDGRSAGAEERTEYGRSGPGIDPEMGAYLPMYAETPAALAQAETAAQADVETLSASANSSDLHNSDVHQQEIYGQLNEDVYNENVETTKQKEFVNNPFDENGHLRPNVEYSTGEFDYRYQTDGQGRISRWKATELKLTNRLKRLTHARNTPGKQAGDHAGHLAGDRFGGSNRLDNLVSQLASINLSEYKRLENVWAAAIQDGKRVSVAVDVLYEGTSARPSGFAVVYTINGEKYTHLMEN